MPLGIIAFHPWNVDVYYQAIAVSFCVQFNIDKKVACDFYLFVFPFTYTGKNESFTVYVYVCVIKSLSSSATPIRPNCRLPPSINADG